MRRGYSGVWVLLFEKEIGKVKPDLYGRGDAQDDEKICKYGVGVWVGRHGVRRVLQGVYEIQPLYRSYQSVRDAHALFSVGDGFLFSADACGEGAWIFKPQYR